MEKGLRFFIWGNWSDYGHLVNIYLFLSHLSLFDNLLSPVMCCPFTISHFKLHLENFSCALYACSNTLYTCCVHYDITKDWPAGLFLPKVYNFPP